MRIDRCSHFVTLQERGEAMDTRPFIILFSASFSLIMLSSVIGKLLESSGVLTKESMGPKWIAVVAAFFFSLFCVMAFSLVPLVLRAFISMQIRIGNGGLFLVKWISGHERAVVYGIWGLFLTGLVIIVVLAREDILKQLR
jgi:hypothetical protein